MAGSDGLTINEVRHDQLPPIGFRQAQHLSGAAQVRLLRHSQPVERRHCALSAGPRLQGAGDHQLRLRPFGRECPTAPPSRDMVLAHLREIVEATDVPVNADFEGGYADDPDGVAESVRLAVETGVAGLSIEDSTGNADSPLYDFDLALARVQRCARGDRQGRRRRGASRRAAKASSADGPISTKPSAVSRPSRTPAPTASMLRASRPASRSPPSSRRSRRSRSTC